MSRPALDPAELPRLQPPADGLQTLRAQRDRRAHRFRRRGSAQRAVGSMTVLGLVLTIGHALRPVPPTDPGPMEPVASVQPLAGEDPLDDHPAIAVLLGASPSQTAVLRGQGQLTAVSSDGGDVILYHHHRGQSQPEPSADRARGAGIVGHDTTDG